MSCNLQVGHGPENTPKLEPHKFQAKTRITFRHVLLPTSSSFYLFYHNSKHLAVMPSTKHSTEYSLPARNKPRLKFYRSLLALSQIGFDKILINPIKSNKL